MEIDSLGAATRRYVAALIALFCLAFLLGPSAATAQTSPDTHKESSQERQERAREAAEKRKKEAAEKQERTQAQQREAAEQRKREAAEGHQRKQAQQHESAEQRKREADERRQRDAAQREKWERQEIVRRQNAMRDADDERAANRARQNADWERDMQRRRDAAGQGGQPAPSGPYSLPGTQTAPARPAAPSASTTSGTVCSANPFCPVSGGYGNACLGVRHSYTGAGAAQTGLRDIVRRCQAANVPDLCNDDRARLVNGGCAQQCAKVATCTAAAAR